MSSPASFISAVNYNGAAYYNSYQSKPKPQDNFRKGDTVVATTEQKVTAAGMEFDYERGKYTNYITLANGIHVDLGNDTITVKVINRDLPKVGEKFKGAELHLHKFPVGTQLETSYGGLFFKQTSGKWAGSGGTTYGAGDLAEVSQFTVAYVPAVK